MRLPLASTKYSQNISWGTERDVYSFISLYFLMIVIPELKFHIQEKNNQVSAVSHLESQSN